MEILIGHQIQSLLIEGYVFISVREPRLLLQWHLQRVVCVHEHWTVRLTWEDFIETFAHHEFRLTPSTQPSLDLDKDHQFYLWKQ